MSANVQSLVANLAKVEIKIQEDDPLLFICTETRITTEINDGEVEISGYKMIRSDSPSRYSGGVVIYYRRDIVVNLLDNLCFGYNNIVVCQVKECVFNGVWILIYHSPSSSHREFVDKLKEVCSKYIVNNTDTYVAGDFNIDFYVSATNVLYRNEIVNFFRLHYLEQKVKKHTRVTQTTRTLIDPFFTDKRNKLKVSVTNDSIADHNTVVIKKSLHRIDPVMKRIKDRSKYNRDAIQLEFINMFSLHKYYTLILVKK